jgi:hypothetical protein
MHEVLGVVENEEFYSEDKVLLRVNRLGRIERKMDTHPCGWDLMCNTRRVEDCINHGITRRPRLTEEAQEKEDHIIRLERMRSQKDQWANGKHAHWLETPADHAKDRDALDAAIEALTGKSRLTEEQVRKLKALYDFGMRWLFYGLVAGKGWMYATVEKPEYSEIGQTFVWTGERMQIKGSDICSLVETDVTAPLDIVQTLRDAGVEVE